jgi:hypothetical protein
MNYTKEQVLEKAKKIITDLNPDALKYEKIQDAYFDEKEKLARGENKGKSHPCWTISILTIGDNINFLTISDKTGEPLYYQNFNMAIFEIEKNLDGKYF